MDEMTDQAPPRSRPMLKLLVADIVQEQIRRIVGNPRFEVAKVESVRTTVSSDLVTLIRVKASDGVHYYEVKVSEKF